MATNKYIIQLIVDTGTGQAKVKGVAKAFEQLDTAAKKTNTTIKDTNKALGDTNSAAGIAGSTVTEFGRLVSDLPYGIQGVSNNLSQLGSMFSLLVVSAGKMNNGLSTTRNVFNLIKDQVLGPVGILVLFQALVAGMEYFSRKTKEANKELKQFNENVVFQGKSIKDYLQILEDENTANETKTTILKGLFAANKDLRDLLEKGGDPLSVTTDYLGRLAKEEEIRAKILNIQEEFASTYKDVIPDVETLRKNEARIQELKVKASGINGQAAQAESAQLKKQNDLIKDLIKLRIDEAKAIYERNKLLDPDFVFEGVDFSSYDLEGIFEIDKDFEEKLKKDVFEVASKVRGFINLTDLFEPEPYFPYLDPDDVEMEAEIDEYFDKLKKKFDEKQKKLLDTAKTIDTITSGLNAINELLNAQAERELTIEKNKTTAQNDELKKRLANEQLSADQRDVINQQIARNEAALVEKQNDIARKQFKRDKAFKIAMAIGDTASSALRAYGSQIVFGDPTSVVRAKIAAGIATAFGLAQVAAISKTKYGETAMPTPNLTSQGGGAASGASATFNVVGASLQTQIAEAIAASENKPVKAYVVSSEVTSAQELDRRIVEGASI